MPGTVRNLLEKFGAGACGDMIRASWAATVEAQEKLEADRRKGNPGDGYDGRQGASGRVTGAGTPVSRAVEAESDVRGSENMLCDGMQVVSTAPCTTLEESGNPDRRTQGVRPNAAKPELGLAEMEIGNPECTMNWGPNDTTISTEVDMEEVGRRGVAPKGTTADRVPAAQTMHAPGGCTPNARRYAPTVEDVNFSLQTAGFSKSWSKSLEGEPMASNNTRHGLDMGENTDPHVEKNKDTGHPRRAAMPNRPGEQQGA